MGGGSDTAYRARAVAFIGVTMGLGAIGGALAILSLKYILTAKVGMALYFGVTIAIQSVLVFVSSMVFWFGRNGESDGSLRI